MIKKKYSLGHFTTIYEVNKQNMFNATEFCSSYGKYPKKWLFLKVGKSSILAAKEVSNMSEDQLVYIEGNIVWLHEILLVDLLKLLDSGFHDLFYHHLAKDMEALLKEKAKNALS